MDRALHCNNLYCILLHLLRLNCKRTRMNRELHCNNKYVYHTSKHIAILYTQAVPNLFYARFIPPHFSPYVIYVDTNNLIAGLSYDQTPQTGDPIHPKWFLAIGFACISVFLFVTGDKKKKVRVRTA